MTDQEIRDQILLNNARLVGNKIAMAGAHSNIDSFYGPYKDIELALLFTDKVKAVGLTVGIYKDENHNEITEYWYKKSTNTPSDWELVEKSSIRLSLSIHTTASAPNGIVVDLENKLVTLQYILKGEIPIKTAYIAINGVIKKYYNNEIQKNPLGASIITDLPKEIGTYTYTLTVIDISNYSVSVDYLVRWGDLVISFAEISAISNSKKTISALTAENKRFSLTVKTANSSIVPIGIYVGIRDTIATQRVGSNPVTIQDVPVIVVNKSGNNITWNDAFSTASSNPYHSISFGADTWSFNNALKFPSDVGTWIETDNHKLEELSIKVYYTDLEGEVLIAQVPYYFLITGQNDAFIQLTSDTFTGIQDREVNISGISINSGYDVDPGFTVIGLINYTETSSIISGELYFTRNITGSATSLQFQLLNITIPEGQNNITLDVALVLALRNQVSLPASTINKSDIKDIKVLHINVKRNDSGAGYILSEVESNYGKQLSWNKDYSKGTLFSGYDEYTNASATGISVDKSLFGNTDLKYYHDNDTTDNSFDYIIVNKESTTLNVDFYLNIIRSGYNYPIIYILAHSEIEASKNPTRSELKSILDRLYSGDISTGYSIVSTIYEDMVSVGSSRYPLYLNDNNKHIGIVYNRLENSVITSNNVPYNGIYVDGNIVTNSKLDSIDSSLKSYIVVFNPTRLASFNVSSFHLYTFFYPDVNNPSLVNTSGIPYLPSYDKESLSDIIYENYISNLTVSDSSEELRPTDASHLYTLTLYCINDAMVDSFTSGDTGKIQIPNSKVTKRTLRPIGKVSQGKSESGVGGINSLLMMNTVHKNIEVEYISGKTAKALKTLVAYCYYTLDKKGTTVSQGVVEVHTQGTSTLRYPVPNFAFTFYALSKKDSNYELNKSEVDLLESGVEESVLTAKADYMDSSHLNNTPTCIFFNKLVDLLLTLKIKVPTTGSTTALFTPSYPRTLQNSLYLDAIAGEPCIIKYVDPDGYSTPQDEFADLETLQSVAGVNASSDGSLINLGSFMLNIDKSGNSLGLNMVEDNSYLSELSICNYEEDSVTFLNCYSIEGGSNRATSAVLFNKDLFDISDVNVPQHIRNLTVGSGADAWKMLDFEHPENDLTGWDNLLISDVYYIINTLFGDNDFEFRGGLNADAWKEDLVTNWDDIKANSNTIPNYINTSTTAGANTLKRIKAQLWPVFRMWFFVANSTDLQFKDNFQYYFDLSYMSLYYINLVCFGQVDNLCKNTMFDTWDGKIWYIRPYDLDSQCGLNNEGGRNIKAYEEFLDTDVFGDMTTGVTTDLNLLAYDSKYDTSLTSEVDIFKSKVKSYLSKDIIGNKNYNTKNNSFLWSKFWGNFSGKVKSLYKTLRDTTVNGVSIYGPEAIIQNEYTEVISKLPTNQYNIDFRNKYLGTSELSISYGDRWDAFKDWITKRFVFADSYFDNYEQFYFRKDNTTELQVNTSTPQYITLGVDSDANGGRQLALNYFKAVNTGAPVVYIDLVTRGVSEIKNIDACSVFTTPQSTTKFQNLVKVDISNTRNIGADTGTSVDQETVTLGLLCGSELLCPYLSEIDISNSNNANFQLIVLDGGKNKMPNLRKFSCKLTIGTPVSGTIKIVNHPNIQVLDLLGYNGEVELENLEGLRILNLTLARLSKLHLRNLPNLESITLQRSTIQVGQSDSIYFDNINTEVLNLSNVDFRNSKVEFAQTGEASKNIKVLKLLSASNLGTLDISSLSGSLEELICTNSTISTIVTGTDNFSKLKVFICPTGIEDIVLNISDLVYETVTINGESQSVTTKKLDLSRFTNLKIVSFKDCTKFKTITNLYIGGSGSPYNPSLGVDGVLGTDAFDMFFNCHSMTDIQKSRLYLHNCRGTFAACYNLTLNSLNNTNPNANLTIIKVVGGDTVVGMFSKAHKLNTDKAIAILNHGTSGSNYNGIVNYIGIFAFKSYINASNTVNLDNLFGISSTTLNPTHTELLKIYTSAIFENASGTTISSENGTRTYIIESETVDYGLTIGALTDLYSRISGNLKEWEVLNTLCNLVDNQSDPRIGKISNSNYSTKSYEFYCNLEHVTGHIPGDTSFALGMFFGCNKLSSIPADIFNYCKGDNSNLENINCAFARCNLDLNLGVTSVTASEDYNNIIANLKKVTKASGLFAQNKAAYNLSSPNGNLIYNINPGTNSIFKGVPKLYNLAGMFTNCVGVTGNIHGLINWQIDNGGGTLPNIMILESMFSGTGVYLSNGGSDANILSGEANDTTYKNNTRFFIGSMFFGNTNDAASGNNIDVNFIKYLKFFLDNRVEILDAGNSYYDLYSRADIDNVERDWKALSSIHKYGSGGSGSYTTEGVFESCKNLTGSWEAIKSTLEGHDCRRMFANANMEHLFAASNTELVINFPRADAMFYKADFSATNIYLITFNDPTYDVTYGDPYNGLYTAIGTFCATKFKNTTPAVITFNSLNYTNLRYLFAASNILYDIATLDLPFKVTDTTGMFAAYYIGNSANTTTFATLGAIDDIERYALLSLTYLSRKYIVGGNATTINKLIIDPLANSYYVITGYFNTTTPNISSNGANSILLRSNNSENRVLLNLRYADHMFAGTGVVDISDALDNCRFIESCRFMFSGCKSLTNPGSVFKNALGYPNLIDVSGMFEYTNLSGELSITLSNAPNVKFADFMFEGIASVNTNPIKLSSLFTVNNRKVQSIIGLCFNTNMDYPTSAWEESSITVSCPIGSTSSSLLYGDYAFARTLRKHIISGDLQTAYNFLIVGNVEYLNIKSVEGLFAQALSTGIQIGSLDALSTSFQKGNSKGYLYNCIYNNVLQTEEPTLSENIASYNL